MKIINKFKKAILLIKIGNKLSKWQTKYEPKDYDRVISEVFKLVDDYGLKSGEFSPSFTLPNYQIEKEFIVKFLNAAKEHGFEVFSNKGEYRTEFKFKKI